jgi:hypothetical protein
VAPLESAPQSADLLVYWRRNQSDQSYNFYGSIHLFLGGAKNPRSDKKIGDREIYAEKIPNEYQKWEKSCLILIIFPLRKHFLYINDLGYKTPGGKISTSYLQFTFYVVSDYAKQTEQFSRQSRI